MAPPERALQRLSVLVACVLLAACAAPAGSPQALGPNGTANDPNHIQFLAWGGTSLLPAYQSLVGLYEQRFPGQTVDFVGLPSQADAQKRLATDFTGGTPADVIVLSYLDLAGYASRGLLAPVAPYLANSPVLNTSQFFQESLGPFIYNRQLQCLPQNISGLVVYYNRSLFRQAGVPEPGSRWTWDQFLDTARALTRPASGGQPEQYGLGLEPTLIDFAPFIWQGKGTLVDNNLWPTELAFNAPAVLTATTWLVSLQTQYHVAPDSQAELAASSQQRFMDGTLAMLIGPRDDVPVYRQITAFDWDVASLPESGGRRTNVILADGYCLSAAAPRKAAAWQFIEFADSPEGQAILAKSGAMLPALTAVAKSSAFLDPGAKPAHGQVYLDAVADARGLPQLENWTDIQAIVDEELQQAFYGQKDAAEALAAAVTRTEEYFKFHSGL